MGWYCVKISKNFKNFAWSFFTYSQSTHSKKQPLKLLRCSDQPFSHNFILNLCEVRLSYVRYGEVGLGQFRLGVVTFFSVMLRYVR